jgi:hypothetical protein
MSTNRETIHTWLKQGKERNAIHMLVVCDTYDHEDYPVFVMTGENLAEIAREYHGSNMQKVMECYDLSLNWEGQLSEIRAWHGWSPNKPRIR